MNARLAVLLAIAASCLPHVDPAPRTVDLMQRATVRVFSSCSEADPFGVDPNTGINTLPDIEWAPAAKGTGVVISEMHILTAAHVVSCAIIPEVTVVLEDGRRFSMQVERDDAMFGDGADLARLEMATAERFDLHIPPPTLAEHAEKKEACAVLWKADPVCAFDVPRGIDLEFTTRRGDSGAGVYDEAGALMGLVVQGGKGITRIVHVDASWLRGT